MWQGASEKLSWHLCRVCFRSSLHAMWLFAVATVGRHSQGAFWQEIFVTAIKGRRRLQKEGMKWI